MVQADLNCDLGESFGDWPMGSDAEMLTIVTSANVACGMHAGDFNVMARTLETAKANGVAVGAHPGFDDLRGFGRRRIPMTAAEVERLVAYQIGALMGVGALVGHLPTHVKVHGALNNMACEDAALARAVAAAAKAVDPSLVFYALPATELERQGEALGLTLAREVFADRAYRPDATLVPRGQPGAMIHDPAAAAENVLRMVREQAVFTPEGQAVPVRVDTICVHGDGPEAVAIARAVRARLEAAGVRITAAATGREIRRAA